MSILRQEHERGFKDLDMMCHSFLHCSFSIIQTSYFLCPRELPTIVYPLVLTLFCVFKLGMFLFTDSMGASLIPVLFFTVLWGVVAGVLPFVIPASPHKSVIQVNLFIWRHLRILS